MSGWNPDWNAIDKRLEDAERLRGLGNIGYGELLDLLNLLWEEHKYQARFLESLENQVYGRSSDDD